MIIKEIADYLTTRGIGSNITNPPTIYQFYLPDVPDNAICIYPDGDNADSDFKLSIDNPDFLIRVRDTNATNGFNKIMEIYNVLQSLHNVTLSQGTYVLTLKGSMPRNIGKDDKGRFEFTMDFNSQISNSTINRY